ncbi:hypothetical protein HPULCUR_009421 [Helicostylum pulchrum]|uniref:Uncharacterized protein n=1 Tax=Helicostylum pulchrum TaxID=562976 RepID=A0ABP9YAD3_9FUNG
MNDVLVVFAKVVMAVYGGGSTKKTDIKNNLEAPSPDIMNMLQEQEQIILRDIIKARALHTRSLLRTRMQNQRPSLILQS